MKKILRTSILILLPLLLFVNCSEKKTFPYVSSIPIKSIAIEGENVVQMGESKKLTIKFTPADASVKATIWSSSKENIATINSKGEVKALAIGKTTIKATEQYYDDVKSTVDVTVVYSKSISINTPSSASLVKGNKMTLIATVVGLKDKIVTWSSSDTSKATIDKKSGEVTAKAKGSVTITATASDKTISTVVLVIKAVSVASVKIDSPKTIIMVVDGNTLSLSAKVKNLTPTAVTWSSSDTTKATVDASGTVTAAAAGSVVITATASDSSTKGVITLTIKQKDTPIVTIATPPTTTLVVGGDIEAEKTLGLSATATGYLTDKKVTWSSSDAKIATVDEKSGMVTAMAKGSVTITAMASDGTTKSQVALTVKDPSVTIDELTSTALEVGSNTTLTATVSGLTDKTVTWKPEKDKEKVATIDTKTGVITAKGEGSVTITVTTNSGIKAKDSDKPKKLTADIKIKVKAPSIKINSLPSGTIKTLIVGGNTLTLSATVFGLTDKTMTWKSSDGKIATVEASTGEVTAVGEGIVMITAIATGDSEVIDAIDLIVSAK